MKDRPGAPSRADLAFGAGAGAVLRENMAGASPRPGELSAAPRQSIKRRAAKRGGGATIASAGRLDRRISLAADP